MLLERIEAWFQTHDDGEFSVGGVASYTGDFAQARTIVYITRPRCLSRLSARAEWAEPLAILGQYSLPGVAELAALRAAAAETPRLFIGDLDPPHLLAYAWLRAQVAIEWYGVSDRFLLRQGHSPQRSELHIHLADSELAALPLLRQCLPDLVQLVGPQCAALLLAGKKIELEGASST